MTLFMRTALLTIALAMPAAAEPEDRQALFGEAHVHTALSFDAYIFGNRNSPDAAYRYAKGAGIPHPAGFEMKLDRPLDFLAVTDHAAYLGMVPAMYDPDSAVADHPVARNLRNAKSPGERRRAFGGMLPYIGQRVEDDLLDMNIVRTAWQEVVAAANRHNRPGKFTAFIGYEYTTSQDTFENLHRNVIFEGARAPKEPFSRLVSMNPERLWDWMDGLRGRGIDSIAIPHNSNGSNGFMFSDRTFEGDRITPAYTAQRMRNEPLVELTQVKGTSETHPSLSPADEFAGFEIMPYQVATWFPSRTQGSYVRQAYRDGLGHAAAGRGNPYKFGLMASSDTHVGAGGFDEDNYWSKIGVVDASGKLRGAVKLSWLERLGAQYLRVRTIIDQTFTDPSTRTGLAGPNPAPGFLQMQWSSWGASGLTGVWAEENTREAIFAAFRRKETFATSGPRMRVRFFGGYDFDAAMLDDPQMTARAYADGVPMGGDLLAQGSRAPGFVVWATRDPDSAPLQRVQIVKGWRDARGKTHEKIYDVACAGGATPDPKTRRCPDNEARVNLDDCSYAAATGADELKAYWRDPDFDAGESAFYYVRGLENPTCRWSTWDAVRAGSPRNPSLAATVQERVWSSPIWYEN